jgi:hypothetical protein
MAGDAFAANPVGVNYDPEELLARFRKGESEAHLLKRPDGPPAAIPVEHGMT